MMSTRSSRQMLSIVCLFGLVMAWAQARPTARVLAQEAPSAQLLSLINLERKNLGLKPVLPESRLTTAMEGHVRWMAQTGQLSHVGQGGSSPASRAMAAGYSFGAIGETLARGQTTAQEVLLGRPCGFGGCVTACDAGSRCNGWKQSPGHWGLLTDPRFTRLGIACDSTASRGPWWGVLLADTEPISQTQSPTSTKPVPSATKPVPSATAPAPSATKPVPSATAPAPTATKPVPSATAPAPTATRSAPTPLPVGRSSLSGTILLEGRSSCMGIAILVDGVLRAMTGSDCGFLVEQLPAGVRWVEARQSGYLAVQGSLSLTDGSTRRMVVQLMRAGELNGDPVVDAADLRVLDLALGSCRGQSGYRSLPDLDGSGCVDAQDRALVVANQGLVGPRGWAGQ